MSKSMHATNGQQLRMTKISNYILKEKYYEKCMDQQGIQLQKNMEGGKTQI